MVTDHMGPDAHARMTTAWPSQGLMRAEMDDSVTRQQIRTLILAASVCLMITACAGRTPAPPDDLSILGTVRAPSEDQARSAISSEQALSVAAKQGYRWPDPKAYLVVLTSPYVLVENNLVWVVRFTGIHWEKPAPPRADGGQRGVTVYERAYVLVDGNGASFLNALYFE
jgi:hypothetical protein